MSMVNRWKQRISITSSHPRTNFRFPWKKWFIVLAALIYVYLWIAAVVALHVAKRGDARSLFDGGINFLFSVLPLVKTLSYELNPNNLTFVLVGGLSIAFGLLGWLLSIINKQ